MNKQHKNPEFQVIIREQANSKFIVASQNAPTNTGATGTQPSNNNSFGAKSPTDAGVPNLYNGFDNQNLRTNE